MRPSVLAAALLFASAAAAQPGPSLAERGQAAYRAGQFAESATLYTAALTAGDRDGSVACNAACSFALAGGGSARVVTKRDRHPDGREFVSVGVLPSVVARVTAEDVRAGRDPVLGAAVRALRGE